MQTDTLRQTPRVWDFLEPAMNPNHARTDHGVLKPAGAGTYLFYPIGQILMQKNDGSNLWGKIGTSGYGGPPRLNKYPFLVDENGKMQITQTQTWDPHRPPFEGSVEMYYQGFFKTQDLVGAGGTNEVQTLTLDTDVDGGTFTLTFRGYTTAAIAWNALAATIKTAMLTAMPILSTSDIAVAGSAGGPYTFTFSGVYAGANVPAITVNITGLTDGGLAVTGDSTAIVESTPGAGLLTGVGRLIRGTSSSGIMELGAATPA
jgi:hypothetical protein